MPNDRLKLPQVFSISRLPKIIFGEGEFKQLASEIAAVGNNILIVTGSRSFIDMPQWEELQSDLFNLNISWSLVQIKGEPNPTIIDQTIARHKDSGLDAVVGIGGGSPLDAAKAIAGLLPSGHSIMDYLEGVGRGVTYTGPGLPFIAVPTTAGTGSEMTKNAVISSLSEKFKKSFRDDQLTATLAIIDPDLLQRCPRDQMIANAMDAFTQLLEAYTSPRQNPVTDALALSGITYFLKGFSHQKEGDLAGLAHLAYSSMISGICLAQTGLGAVHGLASPLGASFPIPHGVACGTLLAAVTETNINALQTRQPDSYALSRYEIVGQLLPNDEGLHPLENLIQTIWHWTEILQLPKLSQYGLTEANIDDIVVASGGNSMKTNPILLTHQELESILRIRM